jgi:hypothetical protein
VIPVQLHPRFWHQKCHFLFLQSTPG